MNNNEAINDFVLSPLESIEILTNIFMATRKRTKSLISRNSYKTSIRNI